MESVGTVVHYFTYDIQTQIQITHVRIYIRMYWSMWRVNGISALYNFLTVYRASCWMRWRFALWTSKGSRTGTEGKNKLIQAGVTGTTTCVQRNGARPVRESLLISRPTRFQTVLFAMQFCFERVETGGALPKFAYLIF